MSIIGALKNTPILGTSVVILVRALRRIRPFPGSGSYWEQHYAGGGDSGGGSYNELAAHKAEVINAFVKEKGIESVIEFGSGDGNQLRLAEYPDYTGVDVSKSAVSLCREIFRSDNGKTFMPLNEYSGQTADLALSLDVIYHLVEDSTYESYMRRLFDAAGRFVLIYSSDFEDIGGHHTQHIKHRKFSEWVEKNAQDFSLSQFIRNKYGDAYRPEGYADKVTSNADFFIYKKSE